MPFGIPLWAQAALWGLLGGSALLVGAAVGYFVRLPQRVVAAVMAFGSGVLISALAFELMDEAYGRGATRCSATSRPPSSPPPWRWRRARSSPCWSTR